MIAAGALTACEGSTGWIHLFLLPLFRFLEGVARLSLG